MLTVCTGVVTAMNVVLAVFILRVLTQLAHKHHQITTVEHGKHTAAQQPPATQTTTTAAAAKEQTHAGAGNDNNNQCATPKTDMNPFGWCYI